MSELPSGWVPAKLKDVVELRTGPFGSSLHQSDYVDGGIPIVNPMHIEGGRIMPSKKHRVSERTAERLSEFRLLEGDIVLGRRGEMGRCAVVQANQVGWLCGTGSLIIRSGQYIAPDFLQGVLSSDSTVKYLMAESVGSTMVNLNQRILLDLDLTIPPRPEQIRIVEKLEELHSDLDAGVAELKAAQRKLAQYRQSLLKAAVEGGLTADWRAARSTSSRRKPGSSRSRDDQPQKRDPGLRRDDEEQETGAELLQRILSERRARWEQKQLAKFADQGKTPPKGWQDKYPEPVAPDLTDLPSLPEGWVWASIDQLSPDDLANGRSVPTAESGPKVLRLTAVREGRIDLDEWKYGAWSEEEARPFAVAKGDLLIVRGNGSLGLVGRAGLVGSVQSKIAYPDTLIRLRVLDTVVTPEWISLVWDSELSRNHFERRARTSAGIYKISQPDIISAVMPVPPLAEQSRIIEEFENHRERIASTEQMLTAGVKQAAAQRKNILKAAFSGQLVPQDPNDEPASALLARIRAQRETDAGTPARKRGRKARGAA